MSRSMSVLAMTILAAGLGACAGSDVISASEQRIVLNVADPDRAEHHCRTYGKSALNTGETPPRVTYTCQ